MAGKSLFFCSVGTTVGFVSGRKIVVLYVAGVTLAQMPWWGFSRLRTINCLLFCFFVFPNSVLSWFSYPPFVFWTDDPSVDPTTEHTVLAFIFERTIRRSSFRFSHEHRFNDRSIDRSVEQTIFASIERSIDRSRRVVNRSVE